MNEQQTIQFIRLETLGDGDCMFWAIEQSLNPNEYRDKYKNKELTENVIFEKYRRPIFHYYLENVKNYFTGMSPYIDTTVILDGDDLKYVTETNLNRISGVVENTNNETVKQNLEQNEMLTVMDNFKVMLPSGQTDNALAIIDKLIQYIIGKIPTDTKLSVTILAVAFHLLTPSCNMNVSVIPIISDYINTQRQENPIYIVHNTNTVFPEQNSKYKQYIMIYLEKGHYESLGRVTETTTENETTTYKVQTIFDTTNDISSQKALQNKFTIENAQEETEGKKLKKVINASVDESNNSSK